jgi:hypothetical protein
MSICNKRLDGASRACQIEAKRLSGGIDMTFKAYLDNIKAKTGMTPEDFHAAAKMKGLVGEGIKAAQIVAWLKEDYGLGHGHAMAIFAVFKSKKWVNPDAKRGSRP